MTEHASATAGEGTPIFNHSFNIINLAGVGRGLVVLVTRLGEVWGRNTKGPFFFKRHSLFKEAISST